MNAIIRSFDADLAEIRDMRMSRLIFFASTDVKVVLNTASNRSATTAFTYLPGRVELHDKQKHIPFEYCTLVTQ